MRDTLEKTWTLEKEPSLIYQLLHNLEETAALHTIELGIPRPVMVERYGVVWMIVRSWMQLDKQPDPASDLTVRTWHRGMTGSMIYRDFDLIQNGERIGQAVQTWVLVDIGSRTLFRMSKVAELADSPRPEVVKDVRPRNGLGGASWTLRLNIQQLDAKGERLPEPVYAVRTLELNYHHECFAGQALPRLLWQEGKQAYVRLMTPEGLIAFDLQATAF